MGQPGAQGPRGFSAWDPIPSGTTVKGAEAFDVESARAQSDFRFSVPLGGRVPALAVDHVNFAPDGSPGTTDDDALCTGTAAAPTAPAGRVCLYATGVNAKNANGRELNAVDGGSTGFSVGFFNDLADSDTFVQFTWAYTAP
ncbi:MAG: hypothetical protein H0V81_03000 [Solirubrobacterales bacterium]|nr:hypothetical protein [Solirubrobacterales bacterium]